MPGTVAIVKQLPKCSFCDRSAQYDFKSTVNGQWAHGCQEHWRIYRMFETLGIGKGQELRTQR